MRDPIFDPSNKTRVKICGLTGFRDAYSALQTGADFIGFIFYEKSPRYIPFEKAKSLIRDLRDVFPPEEIRPVGVFVDMPMKKVRAVAEDLQLAAVQLHGTEVISYVHLLEGVAKVIRAVRVRDESSLEGLEAWQPHTAAFLLDAYAKSAFGGTGESFPHALARPWIERHPVLIAGGLRPDTVEDVVRSLKPFGVDVSTGVESSPGIKDPKKIEAFVKAVRLADRRKFEETLSDIETETP